MAAADSSASRRSLIRAGLAGLAGLALGALGRPGHAEAAPGGSIVMGSANSAGTTNTSLSTASTGTAFQVNQTGTGTALRGVANNGIAGFFSSGMGAGVSGVTGNNTKYGVYAANDATATSSGAALRANGKQNDGIVASTDHVYEYAVHARNTSTGQGTAIVGAAAGATGGEITTDYYSAAGHFVGAGGINALAHGEVDGWGVTGLSDGTSGIGVYGQALSTTGDVRGVYGITTSPTGAGVHGDSWAVTGTTRGVIGTCQSGSATASGVEGLADGASANGVSGIASGASGCGVSGEALSATGTVYGLYGRSHSADGYGMYSFGKAYVSGSLGVSGTLTKGGGSFKIDHPLDPANKYLYHSFVESPDMKNVYDGIATLDAKGEAIVTLPEWFEALNRDLRYQLTPIGVAEKPLYVKAELEDGRFTLAGGAAGQRVCWQVTGIRRDAFAEAHRIPVEEAKTAADRGRYLHPVEHGQAASKGIAAIRPREARAATVATPSRARRASRR